MHDGLGAGGLGFGTEGTEGLFDKDTLEKLNEQIKEQRAAAILEPDPCKRPGADRKCGYKPTEAPPGHIAILPELVGIWGGQQPFQSRPDAEPAPPAIDTSPGLPSAPSGLGVPLALFGLYWFFLRK